MSARILVVEDNLDMAFGLASNLEFEGYLVNVAYDGASALEQLRTPGFDLVILDIILPDISGFDVLRSLRALGALIPVLVLSARGEEVDRVTGFRLGADDYVTKPFSLLELIERVKGLLRRRMQGQAQAASPSLSGVRISLARREVTCHGKPVHLKPMEFDLLCYLVRAGGAVVSRQELLMNVWHTRPDLTTRTVDNTIVSLRRTLRAAGLPDAIRTAPRRGFAWPLGDCTS